MLDFETSNLSSPNQIRENLLLENYVTSEGAVNVNRPLQIVESKIYQSADEGKHNTARFAENKSYI